MLPKDEAKVDFVYGGRSSGDVYERLIASGGDPRVFQPYLVGNRSYIDQGPLDNPRAVPVANVNATLTKDAWKILDAAILKAALQRLRVVADLRAAGLTFTIPQGLGKTVLEYQRSTDINDASVSMDGVMLGANDRVEYDIQYLPLPIIHKDFRFTAREILASRNGPAPMDTTMGEAAGRKVAEMVEKLTLGTASSYTYGGGTIYGLTNFTGRGTQTLTTPTGSNASTTLNEVLTMIQTAKTARHYGPYRLYCATAWDQYMDGDMSTSYKDLTLRQRLAAIQSIQAVETADFLNNYDMVLVEMSAETIRMVIGMDIMTLEWDTIGGMMKNYKVMAIIIPQVRQDINSRCGVVHGSV